MIALCSKVRFFNLMHKDFCIVQFKVLQFKNDYELREEKEGNPPRLYIETEELDQHQILIFPTIIGSRDDGKYCSGVEWDVDDKSWYDVLDNCGHDVIGLCVQRVSQIPYPDRATVKGCHILTVR